MHQVRVIQRVGLVTSHFQVLRGEGPRVDYQQPPLGQVPQVHRQGRRVHRHQRVRLVAGGQDFPASEMHLEGGNTRYRPRRGPDLRREVREGGDGVGNHHAAVCEPFADRLHAVAGVTSETDHHRLAFLETRSFLCHYAKCFEGEESCSSMWKSPSRSQRAMRPNGHILSVWICFK